MWLIRCRLAMWLDKQQDRIGDLADWVSPDEHAWEKYDAWAEKRGYYDWLNKP